MLPTHRMCFITDADLPSLWNQDQRWYLLVEKARLQPVENSWVPIEYL